MTQEHLSVLRRKIKSTAANLVLKYGDSAEEVAWLSLSGHDLVHDLLQAIRDYRERKETGAKIIYEEAI